ncbi:GntR family transcriptional regulator [Salinifilum ghardaiensis]
MKSSAHNSEAVRPEGAAAPWDPARDIEVDSSSPVPLYHQVASQIESAIDAGALPVGAKLDNEVDLAARLGLSRPTVRQAIGSLVDKGLVVRKRGAGTQVAFSRVTRSLQLSSLFDDLSDMDAEPETRVIVNELIGAPSEIASVLGAGRQDQVLHLERVRYSRGEPIARMENYLPRGLIRPADADLERYGLYQLLRSAGVRMHVAQQNIGARLAGAQDAELLDEPEGAPLLTMKRTTHDQTGAVVEFGSHVYRASRYSFDLTLRGDG